VSYQLDDRQQLGGALVAAAGCYWLRIVPLARVELRALRARAHAIPDPTLRDLALESLRRDWVSLEGAAAFAAFVSPERRPDLVRLLIALQSIYQYVDAVMEQPCTEPVANARWLHSALVLALSPESPQIDYYARGVHRQDGGYLIDLVRRVRVTLAALPSYEIVAEAVRAHARRIVFYQSYVNLAGAESYAALDCWGELQESHGAGRPWWEFAAAAGSSLGALALLSAAAEPALSSQRVQAIESLYWPRLGGLHTLLDSLIDRGEDTAHAQHNLLAHYASEEDMATRLGCLTLDARARAREVGVEHTLILAGLVGLYLSDSRAWLPGARLTSERVLSALGGLSAPAMAILTTRRFLHRLADNSVSSASHLPRGRSHRHWYPLQEYSASGLVRRRMARQYR
jgi:tetraprenyl-beta-curcumene synthase